MRFTPAVDARFPNKVTLSRPTCVVGALFGTMVPLEHTETPSWVTRFGLQAQSEIPNPGLFIPRIPVEAVGVKLETEGVFLRTISVNFWAGISSPKF